MEELPFKDISFLDLWQPLCSEERNHLCNFNRGCYGEKFCEIIFKFWPVVQKEISFIRFLIWTSGGSLVQ